MWTDESREESMLAPIFDLSEDEQLDEQPSGLPSSGADDHVHFSVEAAAAKPTDFHPVCSTHGSTSPCSVRPGDK